MHPSWAAELTEHHQAMSSETLAALREHGIVDDVTLIRLEFSYDAPGSTSATDLASYLGETTDYEVEVVRSGGVLRRRWCVEGRTQETTVSAPAIHDWISWMVAAGAEHGGCRFDGWGTFLN